MTAISRGNDRQAYQARSLFWLILPLLLAGLVCLAFGAMIPSANVSNRVMFVLRDIPVAVHSISDIASYTPDKEWAELLLSIQWVFAPIYIFVWFYIFSPLSKRMRCAVLKHSLSLSMRQRMVVLIGGLLLIVYFFGDIGIIRIPTFFNGGFVSPPSDAVSALTLIYQSWGYFSIYAWISPFIECTLLWMCILFVANFKAYVRPESDQE